MNGEKLTKAIKANEALSIEHIDGPYAENSALKDLILKRGA
jgi:N-acetylneuraminate synthase